MKKTLILTVGLPRSGKSTWARSTGFPIVNPDSIRLAIHGQPFIGEAEPLVWVHAKLMVKALFNAGHDTVILDATNYTQARRDEWLSKDWHVMLQPFQTPSEECERRAVMSNKPYLIPVIEQMACKFEIPEGWYEEED